VLRARGKNTWQIVVYAGTDPTTGRERRTRETFHGSKKQAADRERQLVLEARAGKYTSPDHTVAELLAAWLAQVAPDLAATTIYNYRAMIDGHLVPELGAVKLAKLTPARIDRCYVDLRATLAPKSVRNVHAVLRRALAQGQRWGWITTNPATLASPPKLVKPEIRPPARDDVAAFLAHLLAADPDLGTLAWLAAVTGARRGELAGLRWSDVDVDRATLLIERSVAQTAGTTFVKDTKTHQARRIALDQLTLQLLGQHRARLVDTSDATGITFTTDLPVFPNVETFRPLHPDTITKRYRSAADAWRARRAKELDIDIKEIQDLGRLHDLRHFAATQALDAGVNVRTVAGRLGHANPATTLNVYAHFLKASDQDAAEVLGEIAAGSP